MIRWVKNQVKFITIIILVVISCSCKPRFKDPGDDFKNDLKDASPDFKQGWKDGCESGMDTSSTSFNQMFYKNNKIDGYKMSYSGDYRIAWSNAWWYCMRKDWTNQRSSIYGSVFGGYK